VFRARVVGSDGRLDLASVVAHAQGAAAENEPPMVEVGRCEPGERLALVGYGDGPMAFVLSAPGYAPVVRSVELPPPPGADDLGTITLAPGGTIDVRLRWPDASLDRVTLRWTDPAGVEMLASTPPHEREGQAWLVGASPGPITLRPSIVVDRMTRALPPVSLVVRRGETTRVDVDLR
jgi:hypothetical protein